MRMTLSRGVTVSLLLVGLCLDTSCAGSSPRPTARPTDAPTVPDDEGLWDHIPAEAEVIVAVDVAQLRTSGWTRPALESRASRQTTPERDARGFDQLADVDRMAIVRLPTAAAGTDLTVLVGRFEVDRIASAIEARWPGVTTGEFRGVTLWTHGGEAQALVDNETLISGPITAVRAAIDCARGQAPDVRRSSWLRSVRGALDEGRGRSLRRPAVEFAVSLSPEMRARLRQEIGEGDALTWLAARLDLGATLDLSVVGITAGPGQARDMAARLDDLVRQLGQRRSLRALGLAEVLAALRLGAEGKRVVAELRLSDEQREEIAGRLAAVSEMLARAGAAPASSSPQGKSHE